MIDPGHGGDDLGVVGAGGAKEKDLTLAVARRVKASIEARLGVRVLLTRDDDRNVPIDNRTSVANNNKANLFISLHANASLQPAAAGAIIYYAAFDSTDAASLGGVARVPTFSGGTRDLELVAWDLAQTHHLDQSMAFAAMLEERLRGRVPLASQAIARAPLDVLESANMPAVLVEMGFLSNRDQERQLSGGEFQTTLRAGDHRGDHPVPGFADVRRTRGEPMTRDPRRDRRRGRAAGCTRQRPAVSGDPLVRRTAGDCDQRA